MPPCLYSQSFHVRSIPLSFVVCSPLLCALSFAVRSPLPLSLSCLVPFSASRRSVVRSVEQGKSFKFSGTAAGKIEPGLSSFARSPADAGEHILPLLAKASELVPPEKHSTTKV